MFDLVRARLRHGFRTIPLPIAGDALPAEFRGRPRLDATKCRDGCRDCADICPTGAISLEPLSLDLGACLLCPACVEVCDTGAIALTNDHRLAARTREELVVTGDEAKLAAALDEKTRAVLGRALRLRQVSAGGCNGCEAELVALGNVVFDMARFGVQFVASPRHADGIVVTGPVTHNMQRALKETYDAVPSPRLVIAVGACAISGGPFAGASASLDGIPRDLPVDLFIPGCPPHPLTILDGLLSLLGKL